MSQRANNWSVTINMRTLTKERADEFINLARQKGWIINGQLEEGEQGTQHYQLHVKTPQVRFSAVKRMFPTAHIEIARNVKALATYVVKAETRVGTLPEQDEKYMTAQKLWDMIYQKYNIPYDKDGWDTCTDEVRFYHTSDQLLLERDPLAWLDIEAGYLIRQGYNIDQLIVNPAIRSFWKKFYRDILVRSKNNVRDAEDRQTDRQDEISSQHVNIPTQNVDGRDEEEIASQEEDHSEDELSEDESEDGSSESGTDEGSTSDSGED